MDSRGCSLGCLRKLGYGRVRRRWIRSMQGRIYRPLKPILALVTAQRLGRFGYEASDACLSEQSMYGFRRSIGRHHDYSKPDI